MNGDWDGIDKGRNVEVIKLTRSNTGSLAQLAHTIKNAKQ